MHKYIEKHPQIAKARILQNTKWSLFYDVKIF